MVVNSEVVSDTKCLKYQFSAPRWVPHCSTSAHYIWVVMKEPCVFSDAANCDLIVWHFKQKSLFVAEVTFFTADMFSGHSGKSTTATTTMAAFHSGISVSHDRVGTKMGNKTRSPKLTELELSHHSIHYTCSHEVACRTVIKIVLCFHLFFSLCSENITVWTL